MSGGREYHGQRWTDVKPDLRRLLPTPASSAAMQCLKHPADPTMKRCAEECHKCEKVCRDMVKQTGTTSRGK